MTETLALAIAATLFDGISKIASWFRSGQVAPESLAKFEALESKSRAQWDDAVAAARLRLKANDPHQTTFPFAGAVPPDGD